LKINFSIFTGHVEAYTWLAYAEYARRRFWQEANFEREKSHYFKKKINLPRVWVFVRVCVRVYIVYEYIRTYWVD
jgi:hypothetical protein